MAAAGAQALEQSLTVYDEKLKRVKQFKYLGKILPMEDNGLPVMRRNPKKTRSTYMGQVVVRPDQRVSAWPGGSNVLPGRGGYSAFVRQ